MTTPRAVEIERRVREILRDARFEKVDPWTALHQIDLVLGTYTDHGLVFLYDEQGRGVTTEYLKGGKRRR